MSSVQNSFQHGTLKSQDVFCTAKSRVYNIIYFTRGLNVGFFFASISQLMMISDTIKFTASDGIFNDVGIFSPTKVPIRGNLRLRY